MLGGMSLPGLSTSAGVAATVRCATVNKKPIKGKALVFKSSSSGQAVAAQRAGMQVSKVHDPVTALRDFRVVSGQDQRLPGLREIQHPAENQLPRGTVL